MRWQLRRPDSSVIREKEKDIEIAPYSGTWLDKEIYNGLADEREMHLYYEFVQDGKIVSSGSAMFVAPKHYQFADPKLSVRVEGETAIVTSEGYAKGVCVESEDGNLRLSDNFFDMEKGERVLAIIGKKPEGKLRVRSVYDIAPAEE